MAAIKTADEPERRLIFINRFFYPDHSATSQMLSDLAFALAREGRAVSIITSRQRYDAPTEKLPSEETIDGVVIRRVWTTGFGRTKLIGRAMDYATFYLTSAIALLRLVRHEDVVIAKTDPPLLSVVAGPIARLRGAQSVNWLQDIFPEVATASGIASGGIGGAGVWFLVKLRNASLRAASANVVLGERMADRVSALGVAQEKIHPIPNWADGEAITPVPREHNELRTAWGLGQDFVVGYSGNLGRVHEFATFVDAMERLERQPPGGPRILWLFIGGGVGLSQLQDEVARRRLNSVRFQPYQPRERLNQSLSAADVHLVSLRNDLEGLVVPSKYYGIAAAGRPTIFVGDRNGEIARILARTGAGLTVSEGDGAGLAQAVAQLAMDRSRADAMGLDARAEFERDFSFHVALRRWTALFDSVARPSD